ncbi:CHAT domain-containing protein [Okeania sp.]|uniref:CHAT domain-containing protein n=1 Tax=Okeania sp. TaxID=3100323 RepID=UPI002B4B30D6|nr:CHAT domain-containing protein [Okeania sp.]MEB3339191.1 CHAT domain-containing protein [Okeania sp.]
MGISIKQVQAIEFHNNLVKKNEISWDVLTQVSTFLESTLEEKAQHFFQKGNFSASIPLLEAAIKSYANKDDDYSQIRALRNLSLVYLKLGKWENSEAEINRCLNLITKISNHHKIAQITASVLDVKGQLLLSTGQSEAALNIWKKASENYQKIKDYLGLTRSYINQVQALQALGLYSQARKQLETVSQNLQYQPDTIIKAKALQSLGDVLRGIGKIKQSIEVLELSLTIAENLKASEEIGIILISLGNTYTLLENYEAANSFYQQAIDKSPVAEIKIQAMLNLLNLFVEKDKYVSAIKSVKNIDSLLNQLPISQTSIYARINLAQSLIKSQKIVLANSNNEPLYSTAKIADYLVKAVQQARNLGDTRAESYALGNLGKLYEYNQQWQEAKQLTEKALNLAQSINAVDIIYKLKWQLGRILTANKNKEEAILAYSQAIENIQDLRGDIIAASSELKFDFLDTLEPIYRELVELLLEPSESDQQTIISQKNLIKARKVIEGLQLAELDNFFRNSCLDAQPVEIDNLDKNAAIFYTIVLSDRLAVILAIPGQPLVHYATKISKEEVDLTVETLLNFLTIPKERIFPKKYWQPAEKIYNWLINPIEKKLEVNEIKTLVFILEGSLRNIPLASLYDGEKYLGQKYNVAIAPGLELIDPKPLTRQKLEVLAMGITESIRGWPALPNVRKELEDIQNQTSSEILLNESFTKEETNNEVVNNAYQVIHIATHGEFSSNAEDTFILTWDDEIDVEELRNMIKSGTQQTRPIELLVLSACRTATGDNRATLGLAGISVRAGARSTIASLWYVSDEATAMLMKNFYQQLANPEITKAEALRRAQQQIFQDAQAGVINPEYKHPYFWSTFILVGNWL